MLYRHFVCIIFPEPNSHAQRVLGLLCLTPLSTIKIQCFSDIVAVSFIDGGNRRKPYCKSMTNFIS